MNTAYRVLFALGALLLLGSCSTDDPDGFNGFETVTITIDDRDLAVAVAETEAQRSQGLMGVTDLGGLDGMLFIFGETTETGFWMKDTLIPLDIAFFDDGGGYVDGFTMEPCVEDPCPVYRPSGSYRYTLEAPAGDLEFVDETSILTPPR
ncbi:MAG: DUF192 domain-containing protein [Actinomycetota bacterium]